MAEITGIVAVSLDCPDPCELATFYAGLLGVEIAMEEDGYAAIHLDNLWLNFLKIENYQKPTWPVSHTPQQMHLDLSVSDLDAGQRFALEAGAQLANEQPEPEQWRVMIDPVGHPFCLTLLTKDWTPDS